MPKKCTYSLTINQSRSKSVEKCFAFIIFECSHDAVSKMHQLQLPFQNLPLSKSAGKKCAVFVWAGGLSVTFFTVLKNCRHRLNAVSDLLLFSLSLSSNITRDRMPLRFYWLSLTFTDFKPFCCFENWHCCLHDYSVSNYIHRWRWVFFLPPTAK